MNDVCVECGREGWKSKKFNIVLCHKHYAQMKKYGKIIKTQYEPNQIVRHGDTIEILTQNNKHIVDGRILIDANDYDKVKNIRWRLDKKGYGYNNSDKNIYLHNLLFENIPKGMVVDHINGNPLDNRKENLRIITFQNNCQNKCLKKENTSGVAGVSFNKSINKWRARITLNGKEINLGSFNNFSDAVGARLKSELIIFGDKSRLYTNGTLKTVAYDKSDNIEKVFIVYFPSEVPKLTTVEATMEEVMSIKSERGTGALGSSQK